MNLNNKIITVKELREMFGYTQQEFASLLDISQRYISQLEKDSKTIDAVSITTFLKISNITNQSLDDLLNNKISSCNKNKLIISDFYSDSILDKKNKNIHSYEYTHNHTDKIITVIPRDFNITPYNQQMIFDFEKAKRKPIIAVFGARSSGKSSLINSILGKNLLPTNFFKKTDCTIHFKDIKDKPDYIKENVLVFKIERESKYKFDPEIFLLENIYKELDKQYRIILDNTEIYFVRDYTNPEIRNYTSIKEFYENNNITGPAYEIYIINFVSDAPILKNTDIIDTIGIDNCSNQNNNETYNIVIQKNIKRLELPLYMCDIAICLFDHSFSLQNNDREILNTIIKNNKTKNAMIVASKADIYINKNNNILNILSEATSFEESACSTYSVKNDRKDLRIDFENQLKENIKNVIEKKIEYIKNNKYNTSIEDFIMKSLDNKESVKNILLLFNQTEEENFKKFILEHINNNTNTTTAAERKEYIINFLEHNISDKTKEKFENKIESIRETNTATYMTKTVANIDDKTFVSFKETAQEDLKNLYKFLFESEQNHDSYAHIKTIPEIIREKKINRKKQDVFKLYYEINNILLIEQEKIFKKYFAESLDNFFIRNAFNIYNKYIRNYIEPCLKDIMNDITLLNSKDMANFSSHTIKQIYLKNNLLNKNNEAIEEFSKYITEKIRSLIKSLEERLQGLPSFKIKGRDSN